MGIAAKWFHPGIPVDFVMTELTVVIMVIVVVRVVVEMVMMVVMVVTMAVVMVMIIHEENMTQTLLCPSKVYYLTNPTKRAGKKVVQYSLIRELSFEYSVGSYSQLLLLHNFLTLNNISISLVFYLSHI